METGKLNIERGTEYYGWHNNSGMEYFMAYNELIDNSIDNNATEIRFECTENTITIIDNGNGIKDTIEDMQKVLRMYKSDNTENASMIGQYGLGLKEATMRIGKAIVIRSKSEGCRAIEIDVPWYKLKFGEQVDFRYLDNGHEKGTSITIFYADNEPAPPIPTRRSFRYYDRIIKAGKLKIIMVDGNEYIPLPDPVFKESEIKEHCFVGGKRYDLEIGILDKSLRNNHKSGFYIYSKDTGRYFNYAQTTVVDDISARDGLFVSIGLHNTKENWKIDKNKRAILNIADIFDFAFQNIIDRWQTKIYKHTTAEFLDEIAKEMADEFGLKAKVGKEKRNPRENETGGVKPVGTERERIEAEKVNEDNYGKVSERGGNRKIPYLDIHIATDGLPEWQYLSVQKANSLKITLNQRNSFIQSLVKDPDKLAKQMIRTMVSIALNVHKINPNELKPDLVQDIFVDYRFKNTTRFI
jgi:hypothetical protein